MGAKVRGAMPPRPPMKDQMIRMTEGSALRLRHHAAAPHGRTKLKLVFWSVNTTPLEKNTSHARRWTVKMVVDDQ